jgi:ribonuclease P protein component
MKQTLKKHERLHGRNTIKQLFLQGNSFFYYPFFVHYQTIPATDFPPACAVLFSVRKRKIRFAVRRNVLKRRMKEVFRKHKHLFYNIITPQACNLNLTFAYVSGEMLNYATIEKKMLNAFERIINNLQFC